MKKIKLSRGKYTIVDDEDFEWLNRWKWSYNSLGYARMGQNYKTILMHRLIMNTPHGMETDHINGNGLDNRRSNLRICTRSQNKMNTCLSSKNTSGYKGVCWNKNSKKWRAEIEYKKSICLGYFDNKIDAAKAYNQKAKELFGEFAKLNKI